MGTSTRERLGTEAPVLVDDELKALREAIQDNYPGAGELGLLTGYVLVAQFSDGEGDEWLATTAADINDQGASPWAVKGWLCHALDHVEFDAELGQEEP